MAKGKKRTSSKKVQEPLKISFDWRNVLCVNSKFKAAPVHLFSNLNISDNWNKLIKDNLKVEVQNPTAVLPSDVKSPEDCYWIASVVEVKGFFVCLRWEGFEDDDEEDFWLNITEPCIQSVGTAQSNRQCLLPPKKIAARQTDWKKYLFKRLIGSHTLPANFREQISDSLTSDFRIGMKLEAIDTNRVSAVRCATVINKIGTRLQVSYDANAKVYDIYNSWWCDQKSPLIHPIGWAQLVGHELKSTETYAKRSLQKIKTGEFESMDCDFSYFPHLYEQMKQTQDANPGETFEEGMRVEVIDQLNMRTVNVAFVFKVLRYDYLMIGIDGMTADDGCDAMCYHRNDCLPINYCKKYKIPLEKPQNYKDKKKFEYSSYLRSVKAVAAPESLFNNDDLPSPSQSFKKGMYVEAVDLMEPHLVCPAFVKQVAGKLLKISFWGWGEEYDQWIDYRSSEIYPIGYCQITGYMLEHPKDKFNNQTNETHYKSTLRNTITTNSSTGRSITPTNGLSKSSTSLPKKASNKRKKDSTSVGKSIKKIKEFNETRTNNLDFTTEDSNDTMIVSIDADSNDELETQHEPQPQVSQSTCSSTISKPSPLDWSVEDVRKFLVDNEFTDDLAQLFVDQQVTGSRLLQLTKHDLFAISNQKLGPSLKLSWKIEELKKLYQIQQ